MIDEEVQTEWGRIDKKKPPMCFVAVEEIWWKDDGNYDNMQKNKIQKGMLVLHFQHKVIEVQERNKKREEASRHQTKLACRFFGLLWNAICKKKNTYYLYK